MQVADHRGQAVLDEQVREGRFIVVPQNYAIVKQAGNEGCEWITFNTNEINTLSGVPRPFAAACRCHCQCLSDIER
ncbi:hypothetical protein FXO38_36530 [Capsicum annuum]|uniref:Cupin type-1 domain-containing protein n=1 Tax=Capsicum annuum TaxID=4072 RepID=A0A2G2XVM2_CAPAN|nr:hypothetical protein FXO38_36530 [Capsicum annuum]KAF3613357.1 hypothetical protein FXO37_36416 [Capsicum annuum]PHT61489.1 hypothetical protein T459_34663 [Capsicum annuum]